MHSHVSSISSSSRSTLKVKVKVKVKGLPVCANAVSDRLQTNEMSFRLTDIRTLHLLHIRKLSPEQAVCLINQASEAMRMEPSLKHAVRTSFAEL
jgi:hypothetical protein